MKNGYLILFLIAFLFSVKVSAQLPKKISKLMDLVVEIPKSKEGKTWVDLSQKLNAMNHVMVEGYCPVQKLLYLRLDPSEYFNVLVAINEAGFTYYLKKDITVNMGIEACVDKKDLYLRESSDVN